MSADETAKYSIGRDRSMTDKRRRAIAALEVELPMTMRRNCQALYQLRPDPKQQHEIAALIKEENERAEQLRRQLRLLRDQS